MVLRAGFHRPLAVNSTRPFPVMYAAMVAAMAARALEGPVLHLLSESTRR